MPIAPYAQYAYNPKTDTYAGLPHGGSSWEVIPKTDLKAHDSFIAGLRETTLPGDPDKPLAQSLSDVSEHYNPVNALKEGRFEALAGPLGIVGGDVVRAGIEEGRKAWQAAKAGDYTAAAAHTMRAAVPIAGPMIGTLSENLGAGDYKRAAGNVTGAALQFAAGKLGGATGDAVDAKAAAKPFALDQPPIAFDKPAPTLTGRVVEHTIGGEGPFKQARMADLEAKQAAKAAQNESEYAAAVDKHKSLLKQDVTDLRAAVDKASPKVRPGVDELDAGRNTGVALGARKADAQAAFQQLDDETRDYQTTDPETGVVSGPVKPVRLMKEARGIAAELQDRTARYWGTDAEGNAVPYPVQNDLNSAVQSTLGEISKLQKSMTVQQAMELRTTLGEHLRSVAEVLPTRLERVVTRLEGALDTDVQSTLKRMSQDGRISKDTLKAADEARSTWRDLHEPFIRRITALSDTNPEAIAQEFWKSRTSVEDLALAKRVLPPDAYDTLQFHALRQKIVQPAVRNATFQPDKTSAIAAQRDTFQQLAAPEKLMDTMGAVDDARSRAKLRYMVGPQLTDDIVNTAKQSAERMPPKLETELPGSGANTMADWKQGGVIGILARRIISPGSELAGGIIGAMRHGLHPMAGVGIAAGAVALEYGIAKLLVDPAARAQLGRLASAVASGTAHSAEGLAITSALANRAQGYMQEYSAKNAKNQPTKDVMEAPPQ